MAQDRRILVSRDANACELQALGYLATRVELIFVDSFRNKLAQVYGATSGADQGMTELTFEIIKKSRKSIIRSMPRQVALDTGTWLICLRSKCKEAWAHWMIAEVKDGSVKLRQSWGHHGIVLAWSEHTMVNEDFWQHLQTVTGTIAGDFVTSFNEIALPEEKKMAHIPAPFAGYVWKNS